MVTKIQKWGNSLGVRLPKSAAQDAHISSGSPVDITVKNGDIVLHPVQKKEFTLQNLLAAIRPSNMHSEVETGLSGRELL